MARHATDTNNTPDDADVQAAVKHIEERFADFASERGIYMQKCKRIREGMANDYDTAANRGINKKLLKKIIRERDLERKIAALTEDLEPDEHNELAMLVERLGDFGNLPLGRAALAVVEGKQTLASIGT